MNSLRSASLGLSYRTSNQRTIRQEEEYTGSHAQTGERESRTGVTLNNGLIERLGMIPQYEHNI